MLASSSLLETRSEVSTLHGVRLKPYALLQGGFKKPYDLLHSPSRTLRQQTSFCLVPSATPSTQVFLHRMSSAIIVLLHLHSNVLLAPAFAFNVPWHKHPHLSCFCTRIRIYRAVARASASHCAFALHISIPAFYGICVSASFRQYLGFSRVKSYRSAVTHSILAYVRQTAILYSRLSMLSLLRYVRVVHSYFERVSFCGRVVHSYDVRGSAKGFPIAPGSPWGWALSRLHHMQSESASAIHKLTFSRPRGTSVRENRVCASAVIDDRSLSLLTLMSTPPVSPCLRSLSSSLWFFLGPPTHPLCF
ncbi:hypothetical protein R3P38DRAFT_3151929, partial [Favolaschia claudopus]